jgi:hypothetical protein
MQSHPSAGQRTWRVQVADFFASFREESRVAEKKG